MTIITGKVESARKDHQGFKVDGKWYSCFPSDCPKWKQEVSFETDGKNATNIKVTASAPSGGFGGRSGGGFKKDPETDARICRQNALTNAVNLAMASLASGGSKPAISDILNVAKQFSNWTLNGDNE